MESLDEEASMKKLSALNPGKHINATFRDIIRGIAKDISDLLQVVEILTPDLLKRFSIGDHTDPVTEDSVRASVGDVATASATALNDHEEFYFRRYLFLQRCKFVVRRLLELVTESVSR